MYIGYSSWQAATSGLPPLAAPVMGGDEQQRSDGKCEPLDCADLIYIQLLPFLDVAHLPPYLY